MLLLLGRVLAAGTRAIEAGAVLCFDLAVLSLVLELERVVVAVVLPGLLNDGEGTERDPEWVLFFLSACSMLTVCLIL